MGNCQKLVNQQLAWCSALIQRFRGEQAPWLEETLLQSLTWHLQVGYSAFLLELAASQNLASQSPTSVVSLTRLIPAGRACPAEFDELKALESGETWLSLLLSRPTTPSVVASAGHTSHSADLIVASGSSAWGLAEAQQALLELRSLIERNRALSQEY